MLRNLVLQEEKKMSNVAHIRRIAEALSVSEKQVQATAALLEEAVCTALVEPKSPTARTPDGRRQMEAARGNFWITGSAMQAARFLRARSFARCGRRFLPLAFCTNGPPSRNVGARCAFRGVDSRPVARVPGTGKVRPPAAREPCLSHDPAEACGRAGYLLTRSGAGAGTSRQGRTEFLFGVRSSDLLPVAFSGRAG